MGRDSDEDGASPEQDKITLKSFADYERGCRVKRLQERYVYVARKARDAGISPEEVISDMGYSDFDKFNKKECHQFSLSCSPLDLAELGSGFVLYFHFLKFAMLLLVVVFFCGIPAMVEYAQHDNIGEWRWHNWKDSGFFSKRPGCDCLGDNSGLDRSGRFEAGFGSSCAIWDFDRCKDGAALAPGLWCCRSWCFVDASCHVPQLEDMEGSKSLANRYFWDKSMGDRPLVRSSAPCEQQKLEESEPVCQAWADTAFDERGDFAPPTRQGTTQVLLSPGNIGPGQGSSAAVLTGYVVCTIIIAVMIVAMSEHQHFTDRWIDKHVTMPRSFAVMVKGLPPAQTDERVIADWFSKNAVEGKEVEIVKVVIGYDPHNIDKYKQELRDLRLKLQKIEHRSSPSKTTLIGRAAAEMMMDTTSHMVDVKSADILAMTTRMNEVQKILHLLSPEMLSSSGAAVVTFRYQEDKRACLKRWHTFHAKRSYSAPGDCFGWLRGEPLPPFPEPGKSEPRQLKVTTAANPGDINWQRLAGMNKGASKRKIFLSTLATVMMVAISFIIVWGLKKLQDRLLTDSENAVGFRQRRFQALSLIPTSAIIFINFALKSLSKAVVGLEEHDTVSERQVSEAVKIVFIFLFNTSGIIYFVNAQPKEWYSVGGLVDDILFMLILDAVASRLVFLVDVDYFRDKFRRQKLKQAMIDEWNEKVKANCPPKNILQIEAVEEVKTQVQKFKRFFEPADMNLPERYARVLNTVLMCILYAPVSPFAPLIGCGGLILQYALDKLLLLRWYRRSTPKSAAQAQMSLDFLRFFGPLALAASLLVFLTPSWKDPEKVRTAVGMCILTWLILNAVPMKLLKMLLFQKCGMRLFLKFIYSRTANKTKSVMESHEDYYNAQYMWPKGRRYHTEHFAYRTLPTRMNPEILKPREDGEEYSAMTVHKTVSTPPSKQAAKTKTKKNLDADAVDVRLLTPVAEGAEDVEAVHSTASGMKRAKSKQSRMKSERSDRRAPSGDLGHKVSKMSSSSSIWQFDTGRGFKRFDSNVQLEIDQAYLAYVTAGGNHQHTIFVEGMHVLLDFQGLTQQVLPSGRRRNIRRLETE